MDPDRHSKAGALVEEPTHQDTSLDKIPRIVPTHSPRLRRESRRKIIFLGKDADARSSISEPMPKTTSNHLGRERYPSPSHTYEESNIAKREAPLRELYHAHNEYEKRERLRERVARENAIINSRPANPTVHPTFGSSRSHHFHESSSGSSHIYGGSHIAKLEAHPYDSSVERIEDERREHLRERFAHQNAIINSRPAANTSRRHRRHSVVIGGDSADLDVRLAELERKEARRRQQRELRADEEQWLRLRDRMKPWDPNLDLDYYRNSSPPAPLRSSQGSESRIRESLGDLESSARSTRSAPVSSSTWEYQRPAHHRSDNYYNYPPPLSMRPSMEELRLSLQQALEVAGKKKTEAATSLAHGSSTTETLITDPVPAKLNPDESPSFQVRREGSLVPALVRLPHETADSTTSSKLSRESVSIVWSEHPAVEVPQLSGAEEKTLETARVMLGTKHPTTEDISEAEANSVEQVLSSMTVIGSESIEGPPSLISDDTISSMASTAQILQAIKEFVIILTSHPQLQPLLLESAQLMAREAIEEELIELINSFAQDLKVEASTTIEQFAVKLVRRRARMISHTLASEIYPQSKNTGLRMDLLNAQQVIETRSQIEQYLEGLVGISDAPLPIAALSGLDHTEKSAEVDHDFDPSDDEDDVHAYVDELPNLNHLRTFMVESTAFSQLIQGFTALRDAHRAKQQETGQEKQGIPHQRVPDDESAHKEDAQGTKMSCYTNLRTEPLPSLKSDSAVSENTSRRAQRKEIWRSTVLQMWHKVTRPALAPGHQRITYTCRCGRSMYADVQELYPGGAKQLEMKLRRSAAASPADQVDNNTQFNSTTAEGDLGLATISTFEQRSDTDVTLVDETSNTANVQRSPAANIPQEEMFLLLCVSNRRRLELEQLKILPGANDQIMFQDIRRAYLKLRRDRARSLHPKTPKFIREAVLAASRVSAWVQGGIAQCFEHLGLEWAVWWIGNNVFVIPYTANFVRFELVPIRTDLCPQIVESPCLPPEEQVKLRNYHYMPCPSDVKNPALRIPYLHDLFEPGIHLDDHWTETSPKKLRSKLQYTNARTPAIGWGVHIVERTNWPAFAVLSAFGVVMSFVTAVVFSAVCDDPSGGFTVGSFSITCFALVVSVVGAAANTHS